MKNIAIVICAIAALGLAGCGQVGRSVANVTGRSEQCVDGVTYLQFSSGAAVKVDRNGRPVPC